MNDIKKVKLRMFQAPEDGEWEDVDDDKWKLDNCFPVYRKPQSTWEEQEDFPKQTIWFIPECHGSDDTGKPGGLPKWILCYWNEQAGRWVVLSVAAGKSRLIQAPPGGIPPFVEEPDRIGTPGSATCTLLMLDEDTGEIVPTTTTFTVYNWLKQATNTAGKRLGIADLDEFGIWWIEAGDCST
jgi:hypothetical protein